MKKLFNWCKNNFFSVSALFLLAFIPLYPKLPLIDIVQTWVYIRVEDFLIAVVLLLFVLMQIRQKILPRTYLTWPIIVYWAIGLVSAIVSILFIGPHLITYTPQLTILHFLRRIEYMMLFFLAYSMIVKNKKFLIPVIWTLGVTVLIIAVYGAGQKFLGFPAFLTMNEEFAKGVPLRLPPTARIPSTFGGHYDLGAYMVLVIPLLGSLALGLKRWWEKLLFFSLAVMGLITLLFTASRVSFGVYLIAISTMLIWQKKKLLILPVIIASILLLNSVSSASERFYKTFRYSDVIVDLSSGRPIGTLERLEGGRALLQEQERPDEEELPQGSEFIGVGTGGSGGQAQSIEIIANRQLATGSGEIATVSGSFLIQKALVYDISITTRFQGQWPKAVEAFRRNILLGSGYSTLSVASDGDYLRMLGETGILGSIAFLGILGVAFSVFFRKKDTLMPLERAFVVGVFAGIVGLLFNAVLIDVFEASKVAYTLWLLLGIAMAILGQHELSLGSYAKRLWQFFTNTSMFVVYICLIAVFYHIHTLSWYFIGDDFTWLRWATESTLGDVPKYFTDAAGFFYRPIPKLWYFFLYSVFWLKPAMYHFFSLLLLSISSSLVFLIATASGAMPIISFIGAFLFTILAVHHENIYWISGQSSLLSAAFLFGSIYAFQLIWLKKTVKSKTTITVGTALTILSMLSYDGMMVAPLIVWFIGVTLYGQRTSRISWILILIPFYWAVRLSAGAIAPSGDYGYKFSTFLVNAAGNSVSYVGAMLVGPRWIEYMETMRVILRSNLIGVTVVVVFVLFFIALVLPRLMKVSWIREAMIWIVVGFLSLAAYLGLGGVAERYMFVASGFWVIGLSVGINGLLKSEIQRVWKVAAIGVFLCLIVWNMKETSRLQGDWQRASSVTQRTILTIKRQYFPLDNEKAFVMVNMPLRIGRAWIFPTGFDDALWHMFRMNEYGYKVYSAPTIEDAFDLPVGRVTHEVMIFEGDNYDLKRVTKEVTTIPVEIQEK